jgi:phosphate acetyltransferase
MKFREVLRARAARQPARIVLPEADQPAVREAANRLTRDGLARPLLVGRDGLDPAGDPRLPRVAQRLRETRPDRVRDGVHALDLAADPLRFGMGLVALGEGDALVAGASAHAGEVLDAAAWILGPEAGRPVPAVITYLSSGESVVALAYGAAGSEAAAAELAAVGALACRDWRRVHEDPPRVAFLSASGGPASLAGERARSATERFREMHPEIPARGEVDWTAAMGGKEKANVLVFPTPDAGHLAAQLGRWMGAGMVGPVIAGMTRPVGSLSRDAAPDDIVEVAVLAAVLSAAALAQVRS